jgi:hypothetical protein
MKPVNGGLCRQPRHRQRQRDYSMATPGRCLAIARVCLLLSEETRGYSMEHLPLGERTLSIQCFISEKSKLESFRTEYRFLFWAKHIKTGKQIRVRPRGAMVVGRGHVIGRETDQKRQASCEQIYLSCIKSAAMVSLRISNGGARRDSSSFRDHRS